MRSSQSDRTSRHRSRGTLCLGLAALTLIFPGVPERQLERAAATTDVVRSDARSRGSNGFRLVWHDDFNGRTLRRMWYRYRDTYGHPTQVQHYRPRNAWVSHGTLKIRARRESYGGRPFTSAFLDTREKGTYFPRFGRFSVRARIPHGQGLWPAVWLRHRSGSGTAEIDIMEYFHSSKPGWYTASSHLDGQTLNSGRHFEPPTVRPGWHRYQVTISPVSGGVKLEFGLDGTAWFTHIDSSPLWHTRHPGGPLFDIAITLAVGGPYAGQPDDPLGYLRYYRRCAQGSGTPPNLCAKQGVRRAQFPETFEIDWVRYWALD